MAIIKYFYLSLMICYSNISLAQFVQVGSETIERSKDHKTNVNKIDDYFTNKFGGYHKLVEEADVSEDDQKILYIRNEQFIKWMQQDKVDREGLQTTERIFAKADEFDLDGFDFDDLFEKYKAEKSRLSTNMFQWKYHVSTDFIAWDYLLSGKNDGGKDIEVLSKEKGACYGGGMSLENQNMGYLLNACYGLLKATTQDQDRSGYGPYSVNVRTIVLTSGVYWKSGQDVAIGFYPTYINHHADYEVVKNGSITDENKNTIGYSIGFHWTMLDHVGLNIYLGEAYGYQSSLFRAGLSYEL